MTAQMEYRTLGRSGLSVSRAALGTMNFGTTKGVASVDEIEAERIVNEFLDSGHNLVDTADGYAGGQSEEIVGKTLAGKRDRVVLATKAFLPQGSGPNERGLSRIHLTKALEHSLRRLGTDYVDLYQCHQWDDATPIEETMATLDGFVRDGKVRYLGCSNFSAAQIVEAQWAAERYGGASFVSLQAEYSLLQREPEREVGAICDRHGLGILGWSPLGGGVLTGRYRRDSAAAADSRAGRLYASPLPSAASFADSMLSERNLGIADYVATVAAALDTTAATVGLAWLAEQERATAIILGPRTAAQLRENLRGLEFRLPPGVSAALNDFSAAGSA
jgi:aryl-alcohol dehydrogenase-like predicted oxidoreductase